MEGCTHNGCGRKLVAKGLCSAHYERRRKGQDMDAPLRGYANKQPCAAPGCERASRSRGYCDAHYQRWQKGQPLDTPVQVNDPDRGCSVPGCANPYNASGYCRGHYRRAFGGSSLPLGAPLRGNVVLPVGHVRPMGGGYLEEKHAEGWTAQHRLRMEKVLGRPLTKAESVHHKNGDRADNCLENLELWSRYQPAGQRVADKVQYAQEILRLYSPKSLTA